MNRLTEEVLYFKPQKHFTFRDGLSPLQNYTAAIRLLAYGYGADSVDEYVRLGETTGRECLLNFGVGIIDLFGTEYLRRPTQEDLQRLLFVGEHRGFPWMIESIDCMHWRWKNCPTALKGMYSRGTGKPTIVLEVVASQDLWIWHAFFGAPGTCNDLNVLNQSPVFNDIINGRAHEVTYYVNGREYNLAYYLTDGIYPEWATFVKSITGPQHPKHSLFAKRQEDARKDIKRAFGVLRDDDGERMIACDHFWKEAQQIAFTILAILVVYMVVAKGEVMAAFVLNPLLYALRGTRQGLTSLTSKLMGRETSKVNGDNSEELWKKENFTAKESVVRKWGSDLNKILH